MHCYPKSIGKVGEVAFKIDISKAFDKVQWSYLLGDMAKIKFNEK